MNVTSSKKSKTTKKAPIKAPIKKALTDPAVGRTRAQRALGEQLNPNSNVRNENVGQFAGPKPTYGRYNVSEQAQDILNRSLNKKTR